MTESRSIIEREKKTISKALNLRFHPISVESAFGTRIKDTNGTSYLDLTAGWAVANIGYSREEVAKVLYDQYKKLSFTTQLSAPSETMTLLAEELIGISPGAFEKKVWFGHSGSDANEFISKFVPVASGRSKMISFFGSYHGQTMGASSLSGHAAQAMFEGRGNVVKVPYPNEFRPFSGIKENIKEQSMCFLQEVFATVCPPEDTAGIIIEAIQSDGGMVLPPEGFLKSLREICDQYGIYLIFDEVKVGLGRTGKWFAFEHENIIADAIVIGKSLGAGVPISAVVGRSEIMDAVVAGHMFTASGNPISTAAAIENIRIIKEEKLIENANERGKQFITGLEELKEKYDFIGDVRGKGLAIGVEIVKSDGRPDASATAAICYRAYELGLLLYTVGIHSNVLEITPPLIIKDEEVEEALNLLNIAFKDIERGDFDYSKLEEYAGWG
ncbi:aspartate aminotransferase family protein [Sporosarcina sp. PTS2304]|uniref:aspartate aminotransferase family protein n=1 Tax=Sporosarcina sp. PTS2304 TaxID=2283194 RepID=UPI000E0D688E|nr:aspartate aminotransferase family protein [Sporosarcina sp. PTS2304]AXH99821.1 aspartate aminotransferase family protein [Sporosarcina sp. PTS2304]